MRVYNSNAMYSFRDKKELNKEIKMTRVYYRKGKKVVDTFHAERTTKPNKIVIPANLFKDTIQNGTQGLIGAIKEGDYFMGKCRVELTNAEQIYNGIGIVTVINV